jgi:hypothetical protein
MKIACAALALSLLASPALAQNVKITPVGSYLGELCANDRGITETAVDLSSKFRTPSA